MSIGFYFPLRSRASIPLYFDLDFAGAVAVRLHLDFDVAVGRNTHAIACDLQAKRFARLDRVGDPPQFVDGLRGRVAALDINPFRFVSYSLNCLSLAYLHYSIVNFAAVTGTGIFTQTG